MTPATKDETSPAGNDTPAPLSGTNPAQADPAVCSAPDHAPPHVQASAGPAAARPLVPRLPLGVITQEQLAAFAEAMRRYGIPSARLTSGQRIALPGVDQQDRAALLAFLGLEEDGAAAHGGGLVQACPGAPLCPNAQRETRSMALRLETLLGGLDLPAKVRAGVSGCPRCCAESRVRDLGLVGGKNGWTLVFGGNAGAKPRAGDELARNLDDDAALALAGRILAHYARTASPRQRTARFVEAQGLEALLALAHE